MLVISTEMEAEETRSIFYCWGECLHFKSLYKHRIIKSLEVVDLFVYANEFVFCFFRIFSGF